ncbi:MAG TPA: tRNA lysidine(34) synthetase TilS [Desulfobacteraceae bacterium]|nr:tRNA lysidine(34) synthetase TilS [Desulfobacteraceae bacterium]
MIGSLRNKISRTLSDYRMVAPGDLVVTAVSGGPDSVCLIDCLSALSEEFQISLVVAHFDHGLRPDEDAADTAFVHRLAASLNIPCITNPVPPRITPKGSEEEKARTARYRFLEDVRRQTRGRRIAFGHTIDDQAETVIMRLLRGSGCSGLAAIPPVRGKFIIRPMIRISREEVEAYLAARGLDYMLDSSNTGTRYLRNRIRSELMPLLKKYQPRLVERLANTADIIRGDDECLESMAVSWIDRHGLLHQTRQQIPISRWRQLHPALRMRVLREFINKAGSLRKIDTRHLKAIERLAASSSPQGVINLPGGMTAQRSYDKLLITRETFQQNPFRYEIKGPGTFVITDIGLKIDIQEQPRAGPPAETPNQADFDMDILSFPLVLRSFRSGDRFVPLGMQGSKKVKAFFIDIKLPSPERATTPILTSGGRIAWVCGFRLDERFKINENTKRKLRISIERLH